MKIKFDLATPTDIFISTYIDKFNSENKKYDDIINNIIKKFPLNINYEDIIIKIAIINTIYNTKLYDIVTLATNIKYLNIDSHIRNYDISIVDRIASSYKYSNNIYCYSFASKYCSFHNSLYPIYDSIVDELLWNYKIRDNFYKFKRYDLKVYDKFIKILDEFVKFYNITTLNYKSLDKFLWQYGKEILNTSY